MYDLIVFLTLLLLGYSVGQFAERRHYRSIIEREARYNALPAIASRYPPVEPQYRQVIKELAAWLPKKNAPQVNRKQRGGN